MYYNKYNWVNTTNLLAISLENFITENLFKSDLTKAIYATPDYAFRRRFELIDTNKNWENIEASSLQFPFMSYHIDDNWSPIPNKRIFNMEELGYSGPTGLGNLRLMMMETKVSILLYYNREDDARFAHNKLSFMSSANRWITQEVTYNYDKLDLPFRLNIDAEKISFNPKVQENDWLKENRLFVLSFDITAESMAFYPPEQSSDDSNYDPEPFVISEEVIMEFLSGKSPSITTVGDILLDDNTIVLNSFELERATKTTARLSWNIQNQESLTSLQLNISGKSYDLTKEDYNLVIRKLLPGADYTAELIATRGDNSKRFTLKFSMTVGVQEDNSDIVGTTW